MDEAGVSGRACLDLPHQQSEWVATSLYSTSNPLHITPDLCHTMRSTPTSGWASQRGALTKEPIPHTRNRLAGRTTDQWAPIWTDTLLELGDGTAAVFYFWEPSQAPPCTRCWACVAQVRHLDSHYPGLTVVC